MLLIFGYVLGQQVEEREARLIEEQEKQQELIEQEKGYSVADLEKQQKQAKEASAREIAEELPDKEFENEPMHEDYEYADDPTVDFDKNVEREINSLEDFFTTEEIEQATKTAKDFIQAFYAFNGDKPMEHIENAKEYMTERLYNQLSGGIPPRPSDETYSKEVIELEIYEPYNPNDDENITLVARISGDVMDFKGNKSKEEVTEYEIKLVLKDDNYKVDKYEVTSMH